MNEADLILLICFPIISTYSRIYHYSQIFINNKYNLAILLMLYLSNKKRTSIDAFFPKYQS